MREVVVQILQTHDGAKAAMYCFWYGTTKVKFSLSVCLSVGLCNHLMREVVVQILHTHDGAKAAMYWFWYGTTKVKFVLSVGRPAGRSVCLSVCPSIELVY